MHVKLFAEHAVNYFFHFDIISKKKTSTFINLLNLKLIFKTHLFEQLKSWIYSKVGGNAKKLENGIGLTNKAKSTEFMPATKF